MQRGITLDLIMLTVVMQSVFLTDCYYDDFHNAGFRYNVITLSIDMLCFRVLYLDCQAILDLYNPHYTPNYSLLECAIR
jgi:hypothetical protein